MCLYSFRQQGMKRSGSFTVGTYSIVLKKRRSAREPIILRLWMLNEPPLDL